MRKIVSSIDIGCDTIKLVIGEFIEGKLHILSANKVNSSGIENGKVTDIEKLSGAIKSAVSAASCTIGIDIKKSILGVNMQNAKLIKATGLIDIRNDEYIINGTDIEEVIKKSASGLIDEGFVLLGVIPIRFILDDERVTKDPKGMKSTHLGVQSIVITTPKDYISSIMKAASDSGLKIVDIIPNALGDYYSFKDVDLDNEAGAIINIGHERTSISIFNRGILANNKTYKIGGENIIRDIAFLNKIDFKASKEIYRDIALGSVELANLHEVRKVVSLDQVEIELNQYDVSSIAESRIEEILNLAKKQINILTKKEISYIIVTGGLTELNDFNLTMEKVLGKGSRVGSLNILGARDNSYASAIGILKYFEEKTALRGIVFSIFKDSEIEKMNNKDNKISGNTSLLGKVFGYFFDS